MASFSYPPLTPDPDPAPLSPSIPLNPPMVGDASPFIPIDGQNRDLILESIRAWIRHSLLGWTKAWQAYLEYWLALVGTYLNEFVVEADEYITEHAISGYSWRTTATPIASSGTTNVTLTGVDQDHRPVVLGDLVSDQTRQVHYGIVTAIIDPTHATVSYLGVLHGDTVDGITAGDGILVDATDPAHPIVSFDGVGYLVAGANIGLNFDTIPGSVVISSTGGGGGGGGIEAVLPGTYVTVDTTDPTQPVVNAKGSETYNAAGTLVARDADGHASVVDPAAAHHVATKNYVDSNTVGSVVAGSGVTVDDTDPRHPVVSASGGGGGGTVDSLVAGRNVTIDATDPANPVVTVAADGAPFHIPSVSSFSDPGFPALIDYPGYGLAARSSIGTGYSFVLLGIGAGSGISVDNSTPGHPVITADGVPGTVGSIVAGTGISVDNTDPANPIVSATGGAGVESVKSVSPLSVAAPAVSAMAVDNSDPLNPVIHLPWLDTPLVGGGAEVTFHNSSTVWGMTSDDTGSGITISGITAGEVTSTIAGGSFANGASSVAAGAGGITLNTATDSFADTVGVYIDPLIGLAFRDTTNLETAPYGAIVPPRYNTFTDVGSYIVTPGAIVYNLETGRFLGFDGVLSQWRAFVMESL